MSSTRYFDISVAGKCEIGTDTVKLDIQPASEIPDFFTKNSEGKVVFSEPKPMGIIFSPRGQNVWVKIDLIKVNGQFSNAEKYVCLGIKKRSENEYFDVLNVNNSNRYVDIMDGDPVELIPLLSNTNTTTKCTLVAPEEEVQPATFGINTTGFDFGSVYRISIAVHEGQWLINQRADFNISAVGVGSVAGKGNMLLAVNSSGALACSSNGILWTELGTKIAGGYLAYGNGTWCAFNVGYSTDGGKTWTDSSIPDFPGCRCFTFGNGMFITVDLSNVIYTSRDAIVWNKVGVLSANNGHSDFIRYICYGNGKWLAGNGADHSNNVEWGTASMYESIDGVNWTFISTLPKDETTNLWSSLVFADGYFYAMSLMGIMKRSQDGKEWEDVTRCYGKMAYYKNKLYLFNGTTCHIGFLNL